MSEMAVCLLRLGEDARRRRRRARPPRGL